MAHTYFGEKPRNFYPMKITYSLSELHYAVCANKTVLSRL